VGVATNSESIPSLTKPRGILIASAIHVLADRRSDDRSGPPLGHPGQGHVPGPITFSSSQKTGEFERVSLSSGVWGGSPESASSNTTERGTTAMPASASLALQSAVVAALTANAALTTATGGTARVFDDVPPKTPYPYLSLGQTIERDWSTGTDDGREHTLTLHVWSRMSGRKQVHDIAALVRATLHQSALTLDGHRLINLRHEFTEARREPDNETYRALVRFRAVTEPV